MHAKWLTIILLAGVLIGCQNSSPTPPPAQTVTIFAASSLTDAFGELAQAFEEQHPGTQVVLNFAGSSQLATQLTEGAEADLFAAANMAQMARVAENGRIPNNAITLFATNQLTIITPTDNPADIHTLTDIARPGVQVVLAASGVPVRQYTDTIIATLPPDLQANFYANTVSEENNVRQLTAKIALGEADAALVYVTDITPDIAPQVQQIAIPPTQNVTAVYPIAPLTDAPNPQLAQQFIAFVLSETGQQILAKWRFAPHPVTTFNE
ncbi:MAG: molybdate ABC transporter substrate-binding protein [Candidatus Promineifilaceae bacterium]